MVDPDKKVRIRHDIAPLVTDALLAGLYADVEVTAVGAGGRASASRAAHRASLAALNPVLKRILLDTAAAAGDDEGCGGGARILLADTGPGELDSLLGHVYRGDTVDISRSLAEALGFFAQPPPDEDKFEAIVKVKEEAADYYDYPNYEQNVAYYQLPQQQREESDGDESPAVSNDAENGDDDDYMWLPKSELGGLKMRLKKTKGRKKRKKAASAAAAAAPRVKLEAADDEASDGGGAATAASAGSRKQTYAEISRQLVTQPDRFRFYHRTMFRTGLYFRRKNESDEDYERRKSLYNQYPGIILDGEITKMIACVGCGLVGNNTPASHGKVCPKDARFLMDKEVEVVRDLKHNKLKRITDHFSQVQVDKMQCNMCKDLFVDIDVFKVHLKEAHNIETNARKYKHQFGNFVCSECGKKYLKLNILQQHEIIEHKKIELGRYKCEQCDEYFVTRSRKEFHVRIKHTDERPYVCDKCAKAFKVKKHLHAHKLIHTGEKQFECRHCDKKFAKEWTRTQHERIHLGIRPYECEHCSAKFCQKTSLDCHTRTHHARLMEQQQQQLLPLGGGAPPTAVVGAPPPPPPPLGHPLHM